MGTSDLEELNIISFPSGLWDVDKISFEALFCAGYVLSEMVALETKTQITGSIFWLF